MSVGPRRRVPARLLAAGALLLTGAVSGACSAHPRADVVRLGIAGAANGNASVAAAGPRVVVTWAARAGGKTDVYAAFSSDGGRSFGAPVRVNDVGGDARVSGEQAPRVSVADGVHVAWCSRSAETAVVRTSSAAFGEGSFAPAVSVQPEKITGARGWASLAVGPQGAAHIAWLDGRAGDRAARGAMRQDLYHAVRRADGTVSEVRVATDVCFCCKTAVAAGRDGSVYVAWRHIYPPNLRDIAVARSGDGGRTFEAPVRVSADGWALDGCPDDGPSIAVDHAGVLHVAWPTLVSERAGKGIFHSYSTDGGRSFAPRIRLDESGGAAHPQLAMAAERMIAVWDEVTARGSRRVCMRAVGGRFKERGWTPEMMPAMTLGGPGATYPSVAGSGDAAIAAWTEEEGPSGTRVVVQRVDRP
jgi:hypothetical protein